MRNHVDTTNYFNQLANYLTQSNVKNSRANTFNKTLKLRVQRSILTQLTRIIVRAKKKYPGYQQQLNNLSLELLELHQQIQNADASETLVKLVKKYQQLIRLIMMGFAGSSSGDGAAATLQMPIFNKHYTKTDYIEVIEKLDKLLQENLDASPNPYASIGELVINLIIGIFSFFIANLEDLDEETKNKLNQELTNYQQEQKHANVILTQTIGLFNQLAKPIPAAAKSPDAAQAEQPAAHFFLNPLNLQLRRGGSSSGDDQK